MILVLLITACNTEVDKYSFLFVGHSYDWENEKGNGLDPRLLMFPASDFDGYWFGGDICSETSLNPSTIKQLDHRFNLKNPNSHIVLGNHDYRNVNHEIYFNATGRPDFYTSRFENMLVTVLNTNLNSSDCENLNAQYRMIKSVPDSIEGVSHYVLLMHHQIFPEFDGMKGFKANGILDHYPMNCHDASSSFIKEIYPDLVEMEQKGVEVIVVVGDSGWHKGAEAETNAGVTFLASGINNSYYKKKKVPSADFQSDKVLQFDLDTKARTLNWSFVNLNKLAGVEKGDWFSIE